MTSYYVHGYSQPLPGVESRTDVPLGTAAQQDAGSVALTGTFTIGPTATGVTAAGTTQGTATAIGAGVTVVGTVASGTGVALPVLTGMALVINQGANALLVYPASGAAINALSANAGLSVAAGKSALLTPVSAVLMYSLVG